MKTIIAAATAALFAGTAQALPPAPAPAAPVAAATVASGTTAATPSTKRLCVLEEMTGSRLPIKTCKTAAEWDALGVKYTVRR